VGQPAARFLKLDRLTRDQREVLASGVFG